MVSVEALIYLFIFLRQLLWQRHCWRLWRVNAEWKLLVLKIRTGGMKEFAVMAESGIESLRRFYKKTSTTLTSQQSVEEKLLKVRKLVEGTHQRANSWGGFPGQNNPFSNLAEPTRNGTPHSRTAVTLCSLDKPCRWNHKQNKMAGQTRQRQTTGNV